LCRSGGTSGAAIGSRKRVNAAIPLNLAGREIWNTPQLAFVAGEAPDLVSRALLDGVIDAWLRRGLNEVVLAERIEAVVHPGGQRLARRARATDETARTLLLSRVAPLLDPDGPILWDRIRMMPDGIAGLLAANGQTASVTPELVGRLLSSEALLMRAADMPAGVAREMAVATARRCMGAARSPGSLLKLMYELNPTMACASPVLRTHPVASLAGLLPALEAVCAGRGGDDAAFVMDPHLIGFITIRRAAGGAKPFRAAQSRSDLGMLAALAADADVTGLCELARSLSRPAMVSLAQWPGASRRTARRMQIEQAVTMGDLPQLLAIVDDREAFDRDKASSEAAHTRIQALRAIGGRLAGADEERRRVALRFGREGVVVIGAAACAIALMLQVVS
jgi:hypothetical protein